MTTDRLRFSVFSQGLESLTPELRDPDRNEVAVALKATYTDLCNRYFMGSNDELTRQLFESALTDLMHTFVAKRTVDNFQVTCDAGNNPMSVIEQGFLSVRVTWKEGFQNWMFDSYPRYDLRPRYLPSFAKY